MTSISDFKAELFTNSGNFISKLDFLEDLDLPNSLHEWFIDMGVKRFNHVIEWKPVLCDSIDVDFFKLVKFHFNEKLKT